MTKNKNIINEKLDIPEELLEIYRRPPESRTQNNINYLYQECKKLNCFKNLILYNDKSQLMIREIISRVEFSIISKGKIIYSINEPIINMLYVFEGEIIVYKKQKMEKNSPLKRITQEKYSKEMDYILYKGDEYGKEDIKKEKREVQLETKTKCVVGFLSIQDWILIFEKTNLLEKNDIKDFLTKINIFKDINIIILNNLCDTLTIKKISKGDFLVKKGEPFNNIYIIRHGSFKIFFNTKIKITTEYDLNSFSSNKKRYQSANIKYKFEKNCFDKIQYQIITLFSGEFIGDVEYYLGKENYVLFAKCTSEDTEVIEINLKSFESICNKRMKMIFLKEIKNKIEYFEKRCKEIKKVHKKKNFGLKNRYKLMIIKNIEEQNKEVFEKMENKAKYRNQLNDKKLNTIVSSFINRKNIYLTDVGNNNGLSLFSEKINNYKNRNILNNLKDYNTIIKTQNSIKSPIKIDLTNINKKANIDKYYSIKRKKPNNYEYIKKNRSEKKNKKEKKLLFNRQLNEVLNKNNIYRNKSQKINKNLLINKNNKFYSILTDSNAYDFRNMQNISSKNYLIKHNTRELKNKINEIFSYQHK